MTRQLHSGLYEDLLTSALEAEVNARTAEGWWVDVATADSTVRPDWESQNTASPDTPTERRYIEQPDRGTNVVLFVRERKRDSRGETLPYHCLGRARYRSHESERPMKILWELERPMPGWLY